MRDVTNLTSLFSLPLSHSATQFSLSVCIHFASVMEGVAVLREEQMPMHADAVAFLPLGAAGAADDTQILACGCYELDEASNTRRGLLRLYALPSNAMHVTDDETRDIDDEKKTSASIVQTWEGRTPGVFDLTWSHPHGSEAPLLAVAGADGSVSVYRACEALRRAEMRARVLLRPDDAEGGEAAHACLCASWMRDDTIAASHASGDVSIVQIRGASAVEERRWRAHSLETWAVHAMPQNDGSRANCVLFTGADDCAFKCWDVRCGGDDAAMDMSPIFSNSKEHTAGVTCISVSPHETHHVATGSYDERLRVWDLRSTRRPLATTCIDAGGGVWRLRWHPERRDLLLTACMHAGFKVLPAEGGEPLCEYTRHESLAYGVDWQPASGRSDTMLVATCSFYDRALHMWTLRQL